MLGSQAGLAGPRSATWGPKEVFGRIASKLVIDTRAVRVVAASLLLIAGLIPAISTSPAEGQSLGTLEERMEDLRAKLDASAARIEKLRGREFQLRDRIKEARRDRAELRERTAELQDDVAKRADQLYRSGGSGFVAALLDSSDIAEFANRAEMLSRVSERDANSFFELSRAAEELEALTTELSERKDELSDTTSRLKVESEELRKQLAAAMDDYKRLTGSSGWTQVSVSSPGTTSGGQACPVAGPVSFVDSWGAPRSGGRAHEGTDLLADYGTPVVAIVSGAITYASYGTSSGNWLILSGSDGNEYWYMHNQENLVTSGAVSAGQQIATVGDTGNAVGTPHLHFEYHPGGGVPVNPYPLVSSIC